MAPSSRCGLHESTLSPIQPPLFDHVEDRQWSQVAGGGDRLELLAHHNVEIQIPQRHEWHLVVKLRVEQMRFLHDLAEVAGTLQLRQALPELGVRFIAEEIALAAVAGVRVE